MRDTEPWVYVVLFAVVVILGVRGSVRLTRRFVAVHDRLDDRETWVLGSYVIVAWAITAAAIYFGGLSVRRLLGYEPIDSLQFVSAVVAAVVLLIPAFLDYVVDRVARVPWDGT